MVQSVEKSIDWKNGWVLMNVMLGRRLGSRSLKKKKDKIKKSEDFSLSRYFVTYKNGVNERFCIFINTFWELHFSFQDLLKGQVVCRTSERGFSTDKLVENAPKGPNVGSVLHQRANSKVSN